MNANEPKLPVKSFRRHSVKIAIWENRVERGDEEVIRPSASIQKRYCDKDGDYRDTDVWSAEDLLRLAARALEAAKEMEQKEEHPAARQDASQHE